MPNPIVTWQQFAQQEPEMANRGESMFLLNDPDGKYASGLGYLATVRADGGPRVHPISPVLLDGRLYAFVLKVSPKRNDLIRDGRYALHSWPLPFEEDSFNDEEFYVSGRAAVIQDGEIRQAVADACKDNVEGGDVFELSIEVALHKSRDKGVSVYKKWRSR